MTRRILVLDGDCAAAVSIVQSLGRAGDHVTLGATGFAHRAFRSRHVAAAIPYPDPLTDKLAFQHWIADQREPALIVPATERTLWPLHEIRDHPRLVGRLALPPRSAVEAGSDKEHVRRLAVQLGIPVPETVVVASAAGLASPVFDDWLARGAIVIKSVRSKVWSRRGGHELAVGMVIDREQLEIVAGPLLEAGAVQLQRWVPGHGVGIEVLVDHGEIVLAFAHERLHEVPLTGGGSSYRRAIVPRQDWLAATRRLVAALGWHGVAMVELRHDPATGRWHLMELNGRFWGSLALAQFAGVDFPRALVDLLLDGKRPAQVTPRPVYARALHRDLEWLRQMTRVRIAELRDRVPAEHHLILSRPLARSVVEWGRVATGRETWDGAALDDPGPILHDVVEQIAATGSWLAKRWGRWRSRRDAVAAWSRPLGEVRHVLVVCTGNICRSAYTANRLEGVMRGRGISVRSRALSGVTGRPCPTRFASAARERGVELDGHRSVALDPSDLRWADLILVMDDDHARDLAARGEMARARWLGAVLGPGEVEIPDPVDFGVAELRHLFDRMDRAITAVATVLRG